MAGSAIEGGVAGASGGTFDGARFNMTIGDAEEALGRRADDLPAASVEIAGHWRGVALAESQIEVGGRTGRCVEQALGEIHLVNVAGVDVFDCAAGSLQVFVLGKIAGEIVDAGRVLRGEFGWCERCKRLDVG